MNFKKKKNEKAGINFRVDIDIRDKFRAVCIKDDINMTDFFIFMMEKVIEAGSIENVDISIKK